VLGHKLADDSASRSSHGELRGNASEARRASGHQQASYVGAGDQKDKQNQPHQDSGQHHAVALYTVIQVPPKDEIRIFVGCGVFVGKVGADNSASALPETSHWTQRLRI
jgi:hypothetical protein